MKTWPYPGDGNLARARKMCGAYRAVAEQHEQLLAAIRDTYTKLGLQPEPGSPADTYLAQFHQLLTGKQPTETVAQLDQRFSDWGENWHAAVVVTYGAGDWISAQEAAPLINVSPQTLNRHRARGRIEGKFVKTPGDCGLGRWYYKVGDVYALSTATRKRGWNLQGATDTVRDNGRSDGE